MGREGKKGFHPRTIRVLRLGAVVKKAHHFCLQKAVYGILRTHLSRVRPATIWEKEVHGLNKYNENCQVKIVFIVNSDRKAR